MSNDFQEGFHKKVCAELAKNINNATRDYFDNTGVESVDIIIGGGVITLRNKIEHKKGEEE